MCRRWEERDPGQSPYPEAPLRQPGRSSAGGNPRGSGGAPAGRPLLPGMRFRNGGNRQGSAAEPKDGTCEILGAGGCVLHLRLQSVRERNGRFRDCEHAQGAGGAARQLCFPGGHCPPHGAEIRDVFPAVPSGTGVGTAGVEAFPAGDVPLAAACGGGLAWAHLPRAAQGTGRAGGPPWGRDYAAGAEGAGEIRPKQKLYVAVPDWRGCRTPYCAVRLQAGQESQERGGVPGRFLRISPCGRVPGVPQAAAGYPCSGMLGPRQAEIR